MSSASFDPAAPESAVPQFDPGLRAQIERVLQGRPVSWSTRALAGDPARGLATLAGTVRALSGSVAVRLVRGQHRPVVIIQLNPVPSDAELPWDTE